MNNSLKYLLITALLFNIAIAGCSNNNIELDTEDSSIETEAIDDNGGESDRDERHEDSDDRKVQAPASSITTQTESKQDVRVVYKDGKYTANSSYTAPSGQESIAVTVTVKNGLVEALAMNLASDNQVSTKYKALFAEGINELVIGKPLSEVSGFKVVNGSSLTPKGFNSAIEQIKTDAKA